MEHQQKTKWYSKLIPPTEYILFTAGIVFIVLWVLSVKYFYFSPNPKGIVMLGYYAAMTPLVIIMYRILRVC